MNTAVQQIENKLGINKTLKLKFYADPGHGWLAVPIRTYLKSGMVASRFSYVNRSRTMVFLEEDCDASKFFEIMKSQGIEIKTTGNHTNRQSKIRNMDCISNVHREALIEKSSI
jgi:hypothetical protein